VKIFVGVHATPRLFVQALVYFLTSSNWWSGYIKGS